MRSTSLFARPIVCAFWVVGFALALSLGCGTTTHDLKATFGTSFTPPALHAIDPNTVPVNSTPFVMAAARPPQSTPASALRATQSSARSTRTCASTAVGCGC